MDAAQSLLDNMYFNPKRYDLAKVGRYKINKKLGQDKLQYWGFVSTFSVITINSRYHAHLLRSRATIPCSVNT